MNSSTFALSLAKHGEAKCASPHLIYPDRVFSVLVVISGRPRSVLSASTILECLATINPFITWVINDPLVPEVETDGYLASSADWTVDPMAPAMIPAIPPDNPDCMVCIVCE